MKQTKIKEWHSSKSYSLFQKKRINISLLYREKRTKWKKKKGRKKTKVSSFYLIPRVYKFAQVEARGGCGRSRKQNKFWEKNTYRRDVFSHPALFIYLTDAGENFFCFFCKFFSSRPILLFLFLQFSILLLPFLFSAPLILTARELTSLGRLRVCMVWVILLFWVDLFLVRPHPPLFAPNDKGRCFIMWWWAFHGGVFNGGWFKAWKKYFYIFLVFY